MKLATILLLATLVIASNAPAQPFYARGDMYCAPGCWGVDGGNEFINYGNDTYGLLLTTDAAAGLHEFKAANADWSQSWPGSNQRCYTNGPGDQVVFILDRRTHADGWLPVTDIPWNSHYVPAVNSETWEVIGSAPEMGSWTTGVVGTQYASGWTVYITFANAGPIEYKWRANGNWDDQVIGASGAEIAGPNIEFNVPNDGETVRFDFDISSGRYRHGWTPPTSTESESWGGMKQLFR